MGLSLVENRQSPPTPLLSDAVAVSHLQKIPKKIPGSNFSTTLSKTAYVDITDTLKTNGSLLWDDQHIVASAEGCHGVQFVIRDGQLRLQKRVDFPTDRPTIDIVNPAHTERGN